MNQENALLFADSKLKAKLVSQINRLVRRHRLDYQQLQGVWRQVRKEMGS